MTYWMTRHVKSTRIIRFAGGKALDNINGIFRNEESIATYRKSLRDEVIASLQLLFVTLSVTNWVQWHQYREGKVRLRIAADKHRVTTSIVQELHPGLAVTIGAYKELTYKDGGDSTLTVFHRQVGKVKRGKR